jgi:DNA ligase-1
MFSELEAVNKVKGEGLMLRDPESFYENRRSKSLLKVKTFYDDEATILGYTKGTGRC